MQFFCSILWLKDYKSKIAASDSGTRMENSSLNRVHYGKKDVNEARSAT